MDAEALREREIFFEIIKAYEYVNSDGRLDLEEFCTLLSSCFACDDILAGSPYPRDMYNLLIELLEEVADEKKMSLWIQHQRLVDWAPEHACVYPDKIRTYIHIAGLLQVYDQWIYHIGHTLMEIPNPVETCKYFEWVNEDWTFVYTFIDGFHNFLANFLKDFDLKTIRDTGFSNFEALHLSIKEDIGYDDAVERLKTRHSAQQENLKRIELSINSGFFLEAIALQECLISNCLYNYIKAYGKKAKGTSFEGLIRTSKQLYKKNSNDIEELFNLLDKWRKNRNRSIHGFVTSRSNDLITTTEKFISLSNKTAQEGKDICERICAWYEKQAVGFIKTKFEKKNKLKYN